MWESMGRHRAWPWALLAAAAAALPSPTVEAQEDLGHRVPGALGLYAGAQQPLGLYVADRLQLSYFDRRYDRAGNLDPSTNIDADTVFDTVGVTFTFDARPLAAHVSAAAAVFGGRSAVEQPEQSSHSGIGDLWVMPLELGWRLPHLDVVADYAFYAPTGNFRFGTVQGGLGTGHWAHEFSLGAAVYFDRARTWSVSALGTYGLNQKDRGGDLTHGDSVDLEGGAGKRLFGILDVGVATYAHWQPGADRGADVPEELQGVRPQLFSVGPEADLTVRKLRTMLTFRYEYDWHAQAREAGQSFVVALTVNAWAPRRR